MTLTSDKGQASSSLHEYSVCVKLEEKDGQRIQ